MRVYKQENVEDGAHSLSNPESFMSCSHEAGRTVSRTTAKGRLNLDLVTPLIELRPLAVIKG
jgi:RNA-splicing ligase RtcB